MFEGLTKMLIEKLINARKANDENKPDGTQVEACLDHGEDDHLEDSAIISGSRWVKVPYERSAENP